MRKHKVITITDEGRDKGKSFLIVEKSAYEAEKWATRALFALSRVGVEVPDGMLQAGGLGVLAVGLEAFKRLPFEDAEPLLDDMMTCVSFAPDPAKVDDRGRPLSRPLMRGDDVSDGDIAEVGTLIRLRGEVLELHLGFSVAAVLSNLAQAAATSTRQNTPTSREPAARSSRRAKRA